MDLSEEFERFGATHARTRLQLAGACWEYFGCGQGPAAIVILPGALGDGETSFQYISAFEPAYRVIAPAYPPSAARVAEVTCGIAALMQAEGIARAHFVAGSFSGMLAQCFVRQYPERVHKLILAHSGVPSPARRRSSELYLRVIMMRSLGAVRLFARLMNHAAFLSPTSEHAFWRAYFDRTIASTSRDELAMRVRLILDFDQNYQFAVEDLRDWDGQILIVDSESDRYISRGERSELRSLYPNARVHDFPGAGHSGTLESAGKYIELYREFLEE